MPAGSLRRSKGAEGGAVLPARHTLELQHDQQNIRHYRDVLLAFGGLPEQPGKLTPAEFRAVLHVFLDKDPDIGERFELHAVRDNDRTRQ
jgi:hypothetical protein